MTMNHCITPGKKIKFKINFKPTLKPPPLHFFFFFKAVLVTWKMIIMIASYFFLAFPINPAKLVAR